MPHDEDTLAGGKERRAVSELPHGLIVTLEVIEGPDRGLRYPMTCGRAFIGRKEVDVVLTDPTVSSRHAVVECEKGRLFITDLESTNGTRVNGEKVESAPVGNLDEIQVGQTRLLLSVIEDRYGEFQPETDEEDTGESRVDAFRSPVEPTRITKALPNPELPPGIHLVLEVIEGPDLGLKHRVANRSSIIGRDPLADLSVTDPAVSARHCQLEVHNKDKMTIKDLASSNGTRLNDSYISAVKIRNADVIQIGSTKIRILVHIAR